MTDNHMVFSAEIAFIYGGNDSSEEDVFGSEKSSEKIINPNRSLEKASCNFLMTAIRKMTLYMLNL